MNYTRVSGFPEWRYVCVFLHALLWDFFNLDSSLGPFCHLAEIRSEIRLSSVYSALAGRLIVVSQVTQAAVY